MVELGENAVDWLFDFVRSVYDRFAHQIGQQWTVVLFIAVIALAIYLMIGRSKSK